MQGPLLGRVLGMLGEIRIGGGTKPHNARKRASHCGAYHHHHALAWRGPWGFCFSTSLLDIWSGG
jgi:hypothetical protein